MITFIIIGAIGLLLLLVSLPLGDMLELGDGAVSGTSLGAGAVVFGAIGAIVTVNGLDQIWAFVASAVFAVLTIIGVQKVISHLKASEDGQPRSLIGVTGMVTSTITPSGSGEVNLDDPRELERRLAWADVAIAPGTRIVVRDQSGSRVKVEPMGTDPTTTA